LDDGLGHVFAQSWRWFAAKEICFRRHAAQQATDQPTLLDKRGRALSSQVAALRRRLDPVLGLVFPAIRIGELARRLTVNS